LDCDRGHRCRRRGDCGRFPDEQEQADRQIVTGKSHRRILGLDDRNKRCKGDDVTTGKETSMYRIGLAWLCLVVLPSAVLNGADQAAQLTFTGRVLDTQGRPIGDVTVTRYQLSYGASVYMVKGDLVERKITGADGAFTFTAPAESDVYRESSIIARKDGLAMGWAVWRMRENGKTDITLGEPKELAGAVVDEGGAVVADAQVSIVLAIIGEEEDRRYVTSWAVPGLFNVQTDDNGRFAFTNMPGEASFELLVEKPGKATLCTFDSAAYSEGKLHFVAGQADIRLVVSPEARIEGVVVTKADGKPVPGAELMARPDERGLPLRPEPIVSAVDGTFSIGGLAAGGYSVQLMPVAEGIAEWVGVPAHVTLEAGQTGGDVKIEVSKGGLVEVLIKNDDNERIAGAQVNIRDPQSNQWHGSKTDPNGVARIRLAPGDYELASAYKEGYTRAGDRESFAIEDGETKQFEWTLSGLPSITGVVYDDAGTPLEGVEVKIMPGGGGRATPTSDAEGKFKVSWDPSNWSSDTVRCLVARHKERNLAVAQIVGESDSTAELKLRPGATLTGEVVDPNGRGIAGAGLRIMLRVANWGSSLGRDRDVKTDTEGKFEVSAIPPDQRYNVTALAQGYGQREIDLEEARVTGDRVDVGRFELAVANLSVTGLVVDAEGEPVPNADVHCYGDGQTGQPDVRTKADAEGRFTLAGVCAGRIHINANSRVEGTRVYGNVETEGGTTDVEIVVAEQSSGRRYVPKKPKPLVGKPLPELDEFGIELPAETEGNMLLVCFWDMNQRPSRYCVRQLMNQAAQWEAKKVAVILVQAAETEEGALEQWAEKAEVSFPLGQITADVETTRFKWAVVSLPHLILTDADHKVVAEGFSVREVDEKIEKASSQ
jgi:protocatechuate 3,4-dioxygenase beta subunit